MEHKSKNGKTYEIGEIKEYRGDQTYDMVAIIDFGNIEDDEDVKMIGFYFGEYDYDITEMYIRDYKNS